MLAERLDRCVRTGHPAVLMGLACGAGAGVAVLVVMVGVAVGLLFVG